MNLITKDGYIIDNPNEYWNHKKIVNEHRRSASTGGKRRKKKGSKKKGAGKKGGAGKDQKSQKELNKENFDEFIQDMKTKYQNDAGEQE